MKSPNLFCEKEVADIVPDNIKDFANFGAAVIGIMCNFNYTTNNDIKIARIMSAIDKYPEVLREYNKNTGTFS